MENKNNLNSQNKEPDDSINYCKFSQDISCIIIGTKTGFRIINCNPYKNFIFRKMNGGIGIIEMLNNSNIIALTGHGDNAKYSPNKLIIWDDNIKKEIAEILFLTKIKNIKLTKEKLFVICEKKINVFDFDSLELIESFNILNTKKKLSSISTYKNTQIAFLKNINGDIYIKNYTNKKFFEIKTNDANIQYINFNSQGNLLAIVVENGTKIKLYNSSNGKLIKKIDIDSRDMKINEIIFNNNDKFMGVSFFDKENKKFLVDIYKIDNENNNSDDGNFWNFFFNETKKSFANFCLHSKKCAFNFDFNDTIIVVSYEGKFYRIVFDKNKGGDCAIIEEKDIFL